MDLDAAGIVAVLNRRGVDYVVIGAFAAIAHQAPIPVTRDIDLTPATGPANLTRLSAALSELGARIRTEGVPDGLPFAHDARSLARSATWNLVCPLGEFDIDFSPAAFDRGYRDLAPRSRLVRVGGVDVRVADLADVIRSKEAAGRPKDVRVLPTLYRHLADRDRG
jgi:hypothetical protein